MPDLPHFVYWDACVFLDYIEGAAAWMPILDAVLEDATAGDFTIVTSTLSLVEVAYTSSERNGQLNPDVLEAINTI